MCGYSRLASLVLIQHRLCLPSSHYVFAALPTHLLVFFAVRLLATSSKQAKPRGPANEQTSKHRSHAPKRGQSSPESSPVRSTLVCSLAYTPHIWHWHMWDYKMSLISTILQKLKQSFNYLLIRFRFRFWFWFRFRFFLGDDFLGELCCFGLCCW